MIPYFKESIVSKDDVEEVTEKKDDATYLDENLTNLLSNLKQSNINRRIINNVNFNDENITN